MVAAFDILMFTLLDVTQVYKAWKNKKNTFLHFAPVWPEL
jgi:hypothetical protein